MSNDYAIGEWWTGYRRIEGDELRDAERRAEKRRHIATDEPIIPVKRTHIKLAPAPLGMVTKGTRRKGKAA